MIIAGLDGVDRRLVVQRFAGVAGGGGTARRRWRELACERQHHSIPYSVAVVRGGDILLAWKTQTVSTIFNVTSVQSSQRRSHIGHAAPCRPQSSLETGILAGLVPDSDRAAGLLRPAGARRGRLRQRLTARFSATTIGVWYGYSGVGLTDPFQSEGTAVVDRRPPSDATTRRMPASSRARPPRARARSRTTADTVGRRWVRSVFRPGAGGKFFTPVWLPRQNRRDRRLRPWRQRLSGAVRDDRGQSERLRACPSTERCRSVPRATLDLSDADLRGWSLLEVDWDLDSDTSQRRRQGDGFEVKQPPSAPDRRTDPASPRAEPGDAERHVRRGPGSTPSARGS